MAASPAWRNAGGVLQVLLAFLKLGVTAFGGPIAHLGYFRSEFVVRRRWLDEQAYADLLSLCQFLPGPASSQVGFALGMLRAGAAGGIAAWLGFTLPSALLLAGFASVTHLLGGAAGVALLHGLKLVAVAIVAQALWGMARTLCTDLPRVLIAIAAGIAMLLVHAPLVQIGVIVLSGVLGAAVLRTDALSATTGHLALRISRRAGIAALALFAVLLAGLPLLRGLNPSGSAALFEAFYRSGALVFGGGHVVLPLLNEAFVASGWVTHDAFLAGYGAAQAVPGPLFTFAAYLGAVAGPAPGAAFGATLGLVGIFLPGMLLLVGTLPFWTMLRRRAGMRAAMAGINAAVVGLLAAALCNPVWTGAIRSAGDAAIAVAGFALLVALRTPPLVVVWLTVAAAVLVSRLG